MSLYRILLFSFLVATSASQVFANSSERIPIGDVEHPACTVDIGGLTGEDQRIFSIFGTLSDPNFHVPAHNILDAETHCINQGQSLISLREVATYLTFYGAQIRETSFPGMKFDKSDMARCYFVSRSGDYEEFSCNDYLDEQASLPDGFWPVFKESTSDSALDPYGRNSRPVLDFYLSLEHLAHPVENILEKYKESGWGGVRIWTRERHLVEITEFPDWFVTIYPVFENHQFLGWPVKNLEVPEVSYDENGHLKLVDLPQQQDVKQGIYAYKALVLCSTH